ncbi:hypothetical protein HN873_045878 [Arachis hypogaea]
MTPFRALYGREPPALLRGGMESSVEEVRVLLEERNQMLDEIQFQLNRAQNRIRQSANKKRRDVSFEVGDFVYLKLQPYRMKSLAARSNQKLGARFYGPFEVLERIGAVAYRLKLPDTARIHPVFHISQLKKSVGPSLHPQPLPVALTEEGELLVEPEQAIDSRYNNQGDLEVLIKWKELPDFENTWESAATLQTTFPSFHLEDKVALHGGYCNKPER